MDESRSDRKYLLGLHTAIERGVLINRAGFESFPHPPLFYRLRKMRVNLISPEELSNQHLISEYMEIITLIKNINKGKYKLINIPDTYRLGNGHIKFFLNKTGFLINRKNKLCKEMVFRGFHINTYLEEDKESEWKPNPKDIEISRKRIIESYKKKPSFYKWTARNKPFYL